MAHWATYVLVDRSGHEVRAHRWGAADLEILLAAGPEAALAVMRAGELQSEEAVDDGLTEAGVLVDLSERLLLLAHCHRLVEMDLRRAYFLLLGEAWPGWRLRWAYGGMGELADRVGAPRAPLPPPPLPTACRPAADPGQAGVMVTVQRPDGALLLHPLERDVFDLVWLGPGLLDLLPPAETALRLSRHPYLGIHLETGAGSLGLWTTWALASPPGALAGMEGRLLGGSLRGAGHALPAGPGPPRPGPGRGPGPPGDGAAPGPGGPHLLAAGRPGGAEPEPGPVQSRRPVGGRRPLAVNATIPGRGTVWTH